jgi:hypothetical protein
MDKLRIAKLPSGLELWLNEKEAYTVPSRAGTDLANLHTRRLSPRGSRCSKISIHI